MGFPLLTLTHALYLLRGFSAAGAGPVRGGEGEQKGRGIFHGWVALPSNGPSTNCNAGPKPRTVHSQVIPNAGHPSDDCFDFVALMLKDPNPESIRLVEARNSL